MPSQRCVTSSPAVGAQDSELDADNTATWPVPLFSLRSSPPRLAGLRAPRTPSALKALPGTPNFVITGHGWGHGVGMGQWGAYGYAQNGFTYKKILAHYYPGTTLGPAPCERPRAARAGPPP